MIRKILAVLTLPVLCVTLALGASAAHADTAPIKVTCFPVASWDANTDNLPCATVVRPDNDRVHIIQGSATRETAECVVNYANVSDALCHRIPRNRAAPTPITVPSRTPSGVVATCNVLRVCAALSRVAEDGSVRLTIYHALRPIITCTLGNPAEEHGAYRNPCERAR